MIFPVFHLCSHHCCNHAHPPCSWLPSSFFSFHISQNYGLLKKATSVHNVSKYDNWILVICASSVNLFNDLFVFSWLSMVFFSNVNIQKYQYFLYTISSKSNIHFHRVSQGKPSLAQFRSCWYSQVMAYKYLFQEFNAALPSKYTS